MSEQTATPKTVHAIYNQYGDFTRITMDDTDAEMAEIEGSTVVMNAPVSEVLDDVMAHGGPLDIMDDKTWQYIRSDIKTLAAAEPKQDHDLFSVNPPDLPFVLADHRFSLVTAYNRTNLQACLELSEILMAGQNRRPVDTTVLSNSSQQAKFSELQAQSLDELCELQDAADTYLGELTTQNASERALYGDSGPGSAIAEAVARYELAELNYLIDALEDDRPEPTPWVDITY